MLLTILYQLPYKIAKAWSDFQHVTRNVVSRDVMCKQVIIGGSHMVRISDSTMNVIPTPCACACGIYKIIQRLQKNPSLIN